MLTTITAGSVTGRCKLVSYVYGAKDGATLVTGDLAFDGASVALRSAALTGLARLAENPLARPLMKVVLPSLRPLMWDPALAVRIAMADLLLTIGWELCLLVKETIDSSCCDI